MDLSRTIISGTFACWRLSVCLCPHFLAAGHGADSWPFSPRPRLTGFLPRPQRPLFSSWLTVQGAQEAWLAWTRRWCRRSRVGPGPCSLLRFPCLWANPPLRGLRTRQAHRHGRPADPVLSQEPWPFMEEGLRAEARAWRAPRPGVSSVQAIQAAPQGETEIHVRELTRVCFCPCSVSRWGTTTS